MSEQQPLPEQNLRQSIPEHNLNQPVPEQNLNQSVPEHNLNQPIPERNLSQSIPEHNLNQPVPEQNLNQLEHNRTKNNQFFKFKFRIVVTSERNSLNACKRSSANISSNKSTASYFLYLILFLYSITSSSSSQTRRRKYKLKISLWDCNYITPILTISVVQVDIYG